MMDIITGRAPPPARAKSHRVLESDAPPENKLNANRQCTRIGHVMCLVKPTALLLTCTTYRGVSVISSPSGVAKARPNSVKVSNTGGGHTM